MWQLKGQTGVFFPRRLGVGAIALEFELLQLIGIIMGRLFSPRVHQVYNPQELDYPLATVLCNLFQAWTHLHIITRHP